MRSALSLLCLALPGFIACDKRPETQLEAARPPQTNHSASLEARPRDDSPARCLVPTPASAPSPIPSPAKKCPQDPIFGGVRLRRDRVTIADHPGVPALEVEIAITDYERDRGLMYRTQMGENEGMLFVMRDPSQHTFWMHNTCIPLDLMFIAYDGFINGIVENADVLSDNGLTIPCPASFVLEVNAGWSRRHGVKAGQRIELPARMDRISQ